MYGVREGEYEIVRDHNGVRRIEIETNPHLPLINSLPSTKRTSPDGTIYCSGPIVDEVGSAIKSAITDYVTPGGKFHLAPHQIPLDAAQLGPIIRELALTERITKYAAISHDQFIIYVQPHPLTVLIKVVNGFLVVHIYAETVHTMFDVDDGYNGILKCLNPGWNSWKEAGDLTAPIQSPNYV